VVYVAARPAGARSAVAGPVGVADSAAPRVSLIIPTFNYARFVPDAIDSALVQTWRDVEVVVVDDGSTDDTRAAIQPYLSQITYVLQPHQGVAAARNTGFGHSSGTYIGFLDADDTLLPNRVERQVTFFESQPARVGMVFTNAYLFEGESDRRLAYVRPPPTDNVYHRLLLHNYIFSATAMFRRSALLSTGHFEESLVTGEDYDLFLRLARNFDVAYLDEALYCCRVHSASLMRRSPPQAQRETLTRILRRQFDDPSFPRQLRSVRRPAMANVHREIARQHLYLGQTGAAVREILSAALLDPLALASPRRLKSYVASVRGLSRRSPGTP
jgi:teichuronic acid biosynthesis glycosyltransferase TuaG